MILRQFSAASLFVAVVLVALFPSRWAFGQPAPSHALPIRFLDSATGYAIRPEVTIHSHGPKAAERRIAREDLTASGRTGMALERGRHTIIAVAEGYQPMSGVIEIDGVAQYPIDFLLDPEVEPEELRAENFIARQRTGFMLFQGFVVEDNSGQPLPDVRVSSSRGGVETKSNARGFFELYVPVPDEKGAVLATANVLFEKPGYRIEERQYVELSSRGDATCRTRLILGGSKEIIDERALRRRTPSGETSKKAPSNSAAAPGATAARLPSEALDSGPLPQATASSNATIRVPRNIRVLNNAGTAVEYVTLQFYCRRVLRSEWIASWADYTGGSNSLNAGAVALRTYAIGYVNNPSTSSYDICGTTSCQVYGTLTDSRTDTAVNFTDNYVMINSGGNISFKMMEYSAENNQLGMTCGDGFTAPTGGCLYDPVCSGENENGHGRGMCQWGSARWATGRKMAGPSSGDGTPNGFPRRDWIWICQHYYPSLTLVKGAPLVVGDDIKALATVNVRACPGGGISNGIYCGLITTKSPGATGTIIGGPVQITADASGTNGRGGYTWYQIQWSEATIGWSVENYIERVFAPPSAPAGLTATGVATNQINLTWTDTSDVEAGFKIERAASSSGPWLQIASVNAGVTSYADKALYPGSAWYYQVRAFNAAGNSTSTSTASATTLNTPPTLPAIANKTVAEETTLTFSNTASAPDFVKLLTDFEPFMSETANGVVMFRDPRASSSTVSFLDAEADLAAIMDVFSTNGNSTTRALRIQCNFTNATNPWLRLTTASTATFPNPVIDFTKKLRLAVYSDRAVQVAVGCRETTTVSGTAIGSNGGTSGGIEWAGVTNQSGTAPVCTRSLAASNWTLLTFDLPTEPIRSFSGGNGILSTGSGLGVLEHLAIVPLGGTGVYNVYLDDFAVLEPRMFTYGLGPGAPPGASINAATGVFTWTPTEAQGPGTYNMSAIATENSSPPLSVTNTFMVTVNEVNQSPMLAAISNRTVHAGTTVGFTNAASDADVPTHALTFSLDAGAPANAMINPTNGIFNWPTSDTDAGTMRPITVRVTDNGSPPLSAAKSFTVTVVPRPSIQSVALDGANLALSWSAIPGTPYQAQFKDDLNDASWIDVGAPVIASDSTASQIDIPGQGSRFYRIVVLSR